jgi:hypothetical protein
MQAEGAGFVMTQPVFAVDQTRQVLAQNARRPPAVFAATD